MISFYIVYYSERGLDGQITLNRKIQNMYLKITIKYKTF